MLDLSYECVRIMQLAQNDESMQRRVMDKLTRIKLLAERSLVRANKPSYCSVGSDKSSVLAWEASPRAEQHLKSFTSVNSESIGPGPVMVDSYHFSQSDIIDSTTISERRQTPKFRRLRSVRSANFTLNNK